MSYAKTKHFDTTIKSEDLHLLGVTFQGFIGSLLTSAVPLIVSTLVDLELLPHNTGGKDSTQIDSCECTDVLEPQLCDKSIVTGMHLFQYLQRLKQKSKFVFSDSLS